MKLVFVFGVLFVVAVSSRRINHSRQVFEERKCTAPPPLWCLNDDLASLCGVADQCANYKTERANKPITLTLLYESQCPGCHDFILDVLYAKIFKQFDEKSVQIQLVPYGNAKGTGPDMQCQHGPTECVFNKLESCVLNYLDFKTQGFEFITCIEKTIMTNDEPDPMVVLSSCGKTGKVSSDKMKKIGACYNGNLGNQLQKQAAEMTNAVWPEKHQFVPWLMINNVSMMTLASDYLDATVLKTLICEWFVGTQPSACTNGKVTNLVNVLGENIPMEEVICMKEVEDNTNIEEEEQLEERLLAIMAERQETENQGGNEDRNENGNAEEDE